MINKLLKRFNIKMNKDCQHKNIRTITNIYGDAINVYDARSIQMCNDCGKIIYSDYLDKDCHNTNDFDFHFNKKHTGDFHDTL